MPRRHLAPILLLTLAVVAHHGAPLGTFHFDDSHAVQDNPSIRPLATVGRFFTDVSTFSVLPQNHNYRPILLLTYALTAQITGVAPAAFLAVNLAVHALAACLVFFAVARVRRLLALPAVPIERAGGVDLVALV